MEYAADLSDEDFQELVRQWILSNPPYGVGHVDYAWHSYVVSQRVVAWMGEMAERGNRLPIGFIEVAALSISHQLIFLRRNLEWDLLGNHLIKNARALLHGAVFFGGAGGRDWARKARRILAGQVREQVLASGMHYERSPSYHLQVFIDLMECQVLLEPGGLREEMNTLLGRMAEVAGALTHPDGSPSLFNDGGLTMTPAPEACLSAYRRISGRQVVAPKIFAFRDEGYFGYRGTDSLLVIDCGPGGPDFLPAHTHGDVLSFEWSVGGRRVIVDAGNFTYDPGPIREASRSTRMHNTVTLDGLDQSEFWGAHRVARRAHAVLEHLCLEEGRFVLRGSHDGFRFLPGKPVHRRELRYYESRLDVTDEVVGGHGQRVEARLLLHPACRVTLSDRRILIECGPVLLVFQSEAETQVHPAWWAPDFGVRQVCPQLILQYGSAPCRGGFSLFTT